MAKLTPKARAGLRSSAFALPAKRGWPIHDVSHARFALTQVGRSLRAGNISPGEAATIRAKARAVAYGGSNYERANNARRKG